MPNGSAWTRTWLLAAGAVALAAVAACSSDDAGEEKTDAGSDEVTSGGPPKPSEGATSGGEFNAGSSSGGAQSSSSGSGDAGLECDDPDDAPDVPPTSFKTVVVSADATNVAGVLGGATDIDWYAFDLEGNFPQPDARIEAVDAEVCFFVECLEGTVEATCQIGEASTDAEGRPGCCGVGDADNDAYVRMDSTCNEASEDVVTAYLRITSRANACVPYSARVDF